MLAMLFQSPWDHGVYHGALRCIALKRMEYGVADRLEKNYLQW